MALATISVPRRKLGNSNTPTGPFHKIVLAFLMILANSSAEASPISRICSLSLTSLTDFNVAVADSLNSVATRTSVGTGMYNFALTSSLLGLNLLHKEIYLHYILPQQ